MTAHLERHILEWPSGRSATWDDNDWLAAGLIHEHWCRRWPHRLARRLERKGQHATNRWVGLIAWRLEGGFDPDHDLHGGGYIEWIEDVDD